MNETYRSSDRINQFSKIMRSLHRRWRLVIFLPPTYLMMTIMIQEFYFNPSRGGSGFLPLNPAIKTLFYFVGGILIFLLWYYFDRLRGRHYAELLSYRENPRDFLLVAREHQLMYFMICDSSFLPGAVIFLSDGDLKGVLTFIVVSSIFYLKALPSEKKLGEIFLNGRVA